MSRFVSCCAIVLPVLVACGGDDSTVTPGGDGGGDAASGGEGGMGVDSSQDGGSSDGPASAQGLHVEGNTLVDQGKTVRLLGVNHSGGEYACVGNGGYGIFEGPTDATLVMPMLAWKANAIRIPLNEQCWLGINGLKPAYSGKNYQDAVAALVAMIRKNGMYVILDLHWAAPGATVPKDQQPMADADHAPDFWSSVATAFMGDQGVVFDLFNEPYLDSGNTNGTDPWTCLESGCTVSGQMGLAGTYASAGTQSLVDAIRKTGSKNVIMVPGIAYTNDLSGWLAHEPNDPAKNLVASFHQYNFNTCHDASCWDSVLKPIAAQVPLVTGELGEDDCAHGFIDGYFKWADALGVSYLGWTWNTWSCGMGPALITDYTGAATGFGAGFKAHLLSL